MLKKKSLPPNDEGKHAEEKQSGWRLSRRSFLKSSGLLLAASASTAAGQVVPEPSTPGTPSPHVTPGPPIAPSTPVVSQYPGTPNEEVPFAPEPPPSPRVLYFFTPREARTTEAMAARLIPGDENDPGAREAGVLNYIDFALSKGDGFNEPIYRFPPYAQGFEGDEPPEEAQDTPFEVIWVPQDELDRYGYQSTLTAREIFRVGLASLDRYTNQEYGSDFTELSEGQQDQVLMALEDDEADGFNEPSAQDFFDLVREFTIQGMFADPQYGGNRDMIGWRLLNHPGAQRAYTPVDMTTEGHNFPIQRMTQLTHMHPGQDANPHVILPVFGSEEQHARPHQPTSPQINQPQPPLLQSEEE